LAAAGLLIGGFILAAPGIGSLRDRIAHAAGGWLAVGVALEVLSAFSYVVIFRAVFCRRMSWRLSYQFGMAEQGANSVLSVSGAGGLALGAWALRRGGMSTEHIGRRTVAFFFLTSLANVEPWLCSPSSTLPESFGTIPTPCSPIPSGRRPPPQP
jgi:uncharacterized membrane protein YbhN (UPF0104 family)